jgi:hypothetical protein
MAELPKLEHLEDGQWVRHRWQGTFHAEETKGAPRLVAAPSNAVVPLLSCLLDELSPPFLLLWILVVPRTDAEPGRYQSPPVDAAEAKQLLERYADFIEDDGRFHLWFHSRESAATIVFDRHGLIYAYGPLDAFRRVFESAGLREGIEAVPEPHAHHYYDVYDDAETALAAEYEWTISELQPVDE